MKMLMTDGLTRRYGSVTALQGLTLSVQPGEVLGLLGPNGAGKTTTLRLMAGLAEPTSGTVTVAGHNPWAEPEAVRTIMGVVLDRSGLYERLTALENLELFAGLYRLPVAAAREALARTGAADLAHRLFGKLSRGQQQRVALARAVLHSPRLLFLDEPTAGLDPTAAASFHRLIRVLQGRGVTVVLASHDMAEVEQLCDRVAILDRGGLVACETPAHLKSAHGRRTVRATVETAAGNVEVTEWGLDARDAAEQYAAASRRGRILSLHSAEASLAEVFVRLTGRDLQ